MPGLGTSLRIAVTTLTLSSIAFAGFGQTGLAPGKARAGLPAPTVLTQKPPAGKRKAVTPAVEEQAQAPSDQAQTRAWLQDAARQEPVPDERTLRQQMKESKRLQQEKERNEHDRKAPQSLQAPQGGDSLNVAEEVPADALPSPSISIR